VKKMANSKTYVLLLGLALLLFSAVVSARGIEDDVFKGKSEDRVIVAKGPHNLSDYSDDNESDSYGPGKGKIERNRTMNESGLNITPSNKGPKAYGEVGELDCKARFYLNALTSYENNTAAELRSNMSSDLVMLFNSSKGSEAYESAKDALRKDVKDAVLLLNVLDGNRSRSALGYNRSEMAGCVSSDVDLVKLGNQSPQNEKPPGFKVMKKPLPPQAQGNRGILGDLLQTLVDLFKRR
jgi:hypothetical protein